MVEVHVSQLRFLSTNFLGSLTLLWWPVTQCNPPIRTAPASSLVMVEMWGRGEFDLNRVKYSKRIALCKVPV